MSARGKLDPRAGACDVPHPCVSVVGSDQHQASQTGSGHRWDMAGYPGSLFSTGLANLVAHCIP